ncbi:winged helix-turn-helix domain-containing protein [Chitinophaga niabensis]|uniref:Helix-turn-helix domain-containing protein n=1 Tax=Chitinophaga niabensis TaxID=536979 RepID=A0A1N6K4J8_9BACT|nr:helix-turn-helix domain-containing protein [Chitinophaga niabensis]SIO51257.1 Helix-turn-helix domain-containing protein [Chitinophaga niabensis]
MKAQSSSNLIQDTQVAAAMMNPLRIRILEHLREPNSAAGLARILDMPRQQLNYHLRELEKNELIELVEERRKGNMTERVVRATSKSYMVVLNTAKINPEEVQDKFSAAYLLSAATQLIQEVAVLQTGAQKAKKKLPTFTLQTAVKFASPEKLHAFTEELAKAIAKLAVKYQNEEDPNGRSYQFHLFSHPTLKKQTHEKR